MTQRRKETKIQHSKSLHRFDPVLKFNLETGMRVDGRSINQTGNARSGVGFDSSDMYSNYRQMKSAQFQIKAEERSKGGYGTTERCFQCGNTGHHSHQCPSLLS